MENEKFSWMIKKKNFSSLQSGPKFTEEFIIGGCKWYLMAYPKETKPEFENLSLFLMVADFKTLPCRWRRYIKCRLTVVNQLSEKLSQRRETQCWMDERIPFHGYQEMISLTKLNARKGGFLVNNEVEIVAEVNVLEVIGKLDVSEESQDVTQPLKRIKLNDDVAVSSHLHKETSSVKERMDVNGFQVLPSQVESVKRIFERHPDMALEFRAKNQHLRTSCINVLLSLIETLCQSLQDLSIDDLGQAEQALTYLKYSEFKMDWLERKLKEVKEMKIKEQIGETRIQELEEELKVFKQKCSDKKALLEKEKEELKDLEQKSSDIEGLLEKEKAKVLAARGPPLTLDDVV